MIFFWLTLLISLDLCELQSVDLTQLDQPILHGANPFYENDFFAICDTGSNRIWVFRVTSSCRFELSFVWHTPGTGLGPGEIPPNARIKNLARHPDSGNLWVVHSNGVNIFSPTGAFLKEEKLPYNEAWIQPFRKGWFQTYTAFPRADDCLSFFSEQGIRWNIKGQLGIPVNIRGRIISTEAEVFLLDDRLSFYDASVGEWLLADLKGTVLHHLVIPQNPRPGLEPTEFLAHEAFLKKKRFGLTGRFASGSGLARAGDDIFILTHHAVPAIITEKERYRAFPNVSGDGRQTLRVIQALDLKTGRIKGRFFHPVLLGPSLLLGLHGQRLVVFNADSGSDLSLVPLPELEAVKRLDFSDRP